MGGKPKHSKLGEGGWLCAQLLWTKKGTVVPKHQLGENKMLLPSYFIYPWLLQGNPAGVGFLRHHLFSLYSPSKGVQWWGNMKH